MKNIVINIFVSNRWRWYLVGALLFSLVISYSLPSVFAPFIIATFLFPIFFFHVRAGRLTTAFIGVFIWLLFQFILVSIFAATNYPAAKDIAYQSDFGWSGKSKINETPYAPVAGKRIADFLFTGVLAYASGGSLPLIPAVVTVNETALKVGAIIHESHGESSFTELASSVILSLKPWIVTNMIGHAFLTVGVSSLFYCRLERRSIEMAPALRYGLLGITFLVFSLYLECYLSQSWERAFQKSIAILLG